MSFVASLRQRLFEPERRRSVRLVKPVVQLKLAAYLLVVTFAFGMLTALNSWSAYGRLYQATLATAAGPFKQDILEQTQLYLNTSSVLLVGYVVVVLAVTIGYVHRLIGPIVAFERHLRALQRGDYTSRVSLRRSDHVYADMADQLNDLAERLESSGRSRPLR
jgi:methyl-accepting chemotaxis protein